MLEFVKKQSFMSKKKIGTNFVLFTFFEQKVGNFHNGLQNPGIYKIAKIHVKQKNKLNLGSIMPCLANFWSEFEKSIAILKSTFSNL